MSFNIPNDLIKDLKVPDDVKRANADKSAVGKGALHEKVNKCGTAGEDVKIFHGVVINPDDHKLMMVNPADVLSIQKLVGIAIENGALGTPTVYAISGLFYIRNHGLTIDSLVYIGAGGKTTTTKLI